MDGMNIPTPKPNAILKYDIARYPIWYMTRKLFSPNKLRITIRISIHGQNKPPYDRGTTRRILIQTVSASKCRNGTLRYWDQEISTYLPLAAIQSCLYAIAIRDPSPINFMGVKVVTSNVPIKPQFATTKSVNYLPNVGAFVAIWFDSDGFVAEGPSMNVAFVSKENEFVMPLRDNILSGCTAKRVLTLAESLVKEGKEGPISQTLLNLVVEDMKSTLPCQLLAHLFLIEATFFFFFFFLFYGRTNYIPLGKIT
ncbi:D-amino-acid transaminase, chloroplastic [Glycine soja]